MREVGDAFAAALGAARVGRHVRLDRCTTFRTGGTADWLLETRSSREAVRAIALSHRLGLPVTLLGGGSNVLVGERGVRGLVVRLRHGAIETAGPGVVRAGGGVTLNGLVRWTVSRGLAGLEQWADAGRWARPARQRDFSGAAARRAPRARRPADGAGRRGAGRRRELELGYDRSRLQRTGEAVLWPIRGRRGAAGGPAAGACASLGLPQADPARSRAQRGPHLP